MISLQVITAVTESDWRGVRIRVLEASLHSLDRELEVLNQQASAFRKSRMAVVNGRSMLVSPTQTGRTELEKAWRVLCARHDRIARERSEILAERAELLAQIRSEKHEQG